MIDYKKKYNSTDHRQPKANKFVKKCDKKKLITTYRIYLAIYLFVNRSCCIIKFAIFASYS